MKIRSRRNLLLGTFIKGGFVNELPPGFEEFLRGDDDRTMAPEDEAPSQSEAVRDWSTPFITEESDPASHLEASPEASVNDESTADERQGDDGEISDPGDETSSPIALL